MRCRATAVAVLGAAAFVAAAPGAVAQDPEPLVNLAPRTLVFGEQVAVSGTLIGGSVNAGRAVALYQKLAPFTATAQYAVISQGVADAGGGYSFAVAPRRKAYYSVVADATPTAGRQASKGYLVRVRRNVSVRASTRRPRKGRLVRFSGLIRPALSTPAAMVVVQRKNSADAYSAVASTPPAAAGAEASQYTLRVRIRRPGTYRVYVTGTTYFSPGASPPFVLRVRR